MGYIYLDNFKRIGRVDSDGYIYSESLDRVGKIQSDGRIYNENLSYIGRIDSDGFMYLSNMKRIGRIHRDGYVYDELFNRVGKLDSDIVAYIFGSTLKSDESSIKSSSTSSYSESLPGDLLGSCIGIGVTIIIIIAVLYFLANSISVSNYPNSSSKHTNTSNSVADNIDEKLTVVRKLNAYVGGLHPTRIKDVEDNMGNVYSGAFYSYAAEHSAVYDIGTEYDVLKGIVAVGKPMTPDETFTGEIKVYGDGQLIWSDDGINSSMKPYEMSVSVFGVTDLEIVIDSNGPGPVIFADVVLQKTTVRNTNIVYDTGDSDSIANNLDEKLVSIALRTLDADVGELHPTRIKDVEDNMGNVYPGAFYSYAAENSAIYNIGTEYDILKGIVAVGKPMTPDETFTGEIKVYGDGQLIWSDDGINSSMKPYEMSVSVFGVTDLEIVIDSNGPGPVIFADVVLQKISK